MNVEMASPLAAKHLLAIAQQIQKDASAIFLPPEEGQQAESQNVIPLSVVRNTRGYIESIANQANGCYHRGWFDACAVMVRRLVETVIIEAYEHHSIAAKIQKNGDFLYLRDLISSALSEPAWNLSRNTKAALPRLKDIGDKSAHSRRFNAHRRDLDSVRDDVRVVVQEFMYLAALK